MLSSPRPNGGLRVRNSGTIVSPRPLSGGQRVRREWKDSKSMSFSGGLRAKEARVVAKVAPGKGRFADSDIAEQRRTPC